jgi:hypothetical protein
MPSDASEPDMRIFRTAVALLAVIPDLAPGAGQKPGDDGMPLDEAASKLVQQLGHPRFPVREAAGRQLIEMGSGAVPALTAGTRAGDEEVRARCAALLPRAWAVEWRRRADAYLADADGKHKHELPLLAEWVKLVGPADAGSRKLFADMVRANGNLLAAATRDGTAARAEITKRSYELRAATRGDADPAVAATAADVAALLFAQTVAEAGQASETPPLWAPAYLLYTSPAAVNAAGAGESARAYRRLLAGWAASRPLTDVEAANGLVRVALRYPLQEAAPQLARVARSRADEVLASDALTGLLRAGGEPARAALEGLLANDTPIRREPALGGPESRDGALAALVTLAGKDPAAFGLRVSSQWTRYVGDPAGPVTVRAYTFQTSEARTSAITKWRAERPGGDKR